MARVYGSSASPTCDFCALRWALAGSVAPAAVPESHCPPRNWLDAGRMGQHAGDLRSDGGGFGSALDEGTKRYRRLDYRGILDAPLLDSAAETARYYQGQDRR